MVLIDWLPAQPVLSFYCRTITGNKCQRYRALPMRETTVLRRSVLVSGVQVAGASAIPGPKIRVISEGIYT